MPSLGVPRTHWPVVAWIRLSVPPPPAPMVLSGAPPHPDPPLDELAPNPVTTDPRRRVWALEEERDGWILRLVWDADDPTVLSAECRAPLYSGRPDRAMVNEFWEAVRAKTRPLGPRPVEGADPMP
jgi:hypothetical protein